MSENAPTRVELWPQEIEMGDAVSDDALDGKKVVATYLRLFDNEQGVEVVAFLNEETTRRFLAYARTGVFGESQS